MGSKCETCAHEYDTMYSPHCAPCRAGEGSPKWESKSDYVQVVRCKDCKHWERGKFGNGTCEHMMGDQFCYSGPEDYCSCGVRSDENG